MNLCSFPKLAQLTCILVCHENKQIALKNCKKKLLEYFVFSFVCKTVIYNHKLLIIYFLRKRERKIEKKKTSIQFKHLIEGVEVEKKLQTRSTWYDVF